MKNTKKISKNEISEIIKKFNSKKIYELNAIFCELINYYDGHIYLMKDFNTIMQGRNPLEIVNSVNSNFCINHEYFYFDSYGNATSLNYLDYTNLPIFTINIAETILENLKEFKHLFN